MFRLTTKLVQRRFSTKKIPIHVPKEPIDTTKLHLINQKLHQELGPIYLEKLGPDVEALWIADPRMSEKIFRNEAKYPMHVVPRCWQVFNENYNLKRGLFFLDGQEWHEMRTKMNPIFLKKQGIDMVQRHHEKITEEFINLYFPKKSGDSVDLDLEVLLKKWSVESMLAMLYGDAYESCQDVEDFIRHVQDMFEASAVLQTVSADEACATNTLPWQSFRSAVEGSMNFLQSNFSKFKHSNGLLSLLHKDFNDEDVARIAYDLIIAAADTTSYTTLWTLYLLAMNPDERVQAKASFREAMRLFPVAPFLTRIQQEPLDLDGFSIKSGQLVLLSIYAMGRDANIFPNPEEFRPNRWIRKSGKLEEVANPFASLPFGFGSRSCIGKKLAESQMEHLLTTIFSHFSVKVLNKDPVTMTMKLIGLPNQSIHFRAIKK